MTDQSENQPPAEFIHQRSYLHLLIYRRRMATMVMVSVNAQRHHGPTSPMVTTTVEHQLMTAPVIRLLSGRLEMRPIVLDSFGHHSRFRFVFLTRVTREQMRQWSVDNGQQRSRRGQLPRVSYILRQYTSIGGEILTGLDIIINRACPFGRRPTSPGANFRDNRNPGWRVREPEREVVKTLGGYPDPPASPIQIPLSASASPASSFTSSAESSELGDEREGVFGRNSTGRRAVEGQTHQKQ